MINKILFLTSILSFISYSSPFFIKRKAFFSNSYIITKEKYNIERNITLPILTGNTKNNYQSRKITGKDMETFFKIWATMLIFTCPVLIHPDEGV